MNTETLITKLAWDPITYVAATIFLHNLTQLVLAIKSKPKIEDSPYGSTSAQLTSLHSTTKEISKVVRNIAETIATIISTQIDIDETEADVAKKLERLTNMVLNLVNLHNDPNSKFSTVKVLEREEEIVRMLNEIKIQLAGLRI